MIMIKKKPTLLVFFLASAGIIISFLLLSQHYRLLKKGFAESSFCNINEWINCDVVNASSYSEIGGVPLAGLGLVFYLIIFFYSLIALTEKKPKKEGLSFCFFASLGSLLFVLYTAYVSLYILHTFCILCVALYLITLLVVLTLPYALNYSIGSTGSFVAEYFRASFHRKNSLGFDPKWKKHAVILIIFYGLSIFLFHQMEKNLNAADRKHPQNKKPPDLATLVSQHFQQTPVAIDTTGRPFWGNPSAPVKIVEFSDFQCPFCRIAAKSIKPSIAEYKDQVALYFFNYPLDLSCNVYMTRVLHENACNAAKAAVCADQEGSFWPYHDLLFENQKFLSSGDLLAYGEKLKMDKKKFMDCLFSESTTNRVKNDIEAGKKVEVSGTPAVFVNGRRLVGWNNVKLLRAVIEKEMPK